MSANIPPEIALTIFLLAAALLIGAFTALFAWLDRDRTPKRGRHRLRT